MQTQHSKRLAISLSPHLHIIVIVLVGETRRLELPVKAVKAVVEIFVLCCKGMYVVIALTSCGQHLIELFHCIPSLL